MCNVHMFIVNVYDSDLWQCAGEIEGHALESILEAERQRHMAAVQALARVEAGDCERQSS